MSVVSKVLREAHKGVVRVTLADRSGRQCIVYSLLTWETRAGRLSRSPASQVSGVASFFWSVWEANLTKAKRTVQYYIDAEANLDFHPRHRTTLFELVSQSGRYLQSPVKNGQRG